MIYFNSIKRLKNITSLLFAFVFVGGIVTSCEFDLFDYHETVEPSINFLNIEGIDGEVYLAGEVIDEGASEIEIIGVCYNKTGNPGILEHQILYQAVQGVFTINIGALDEDVDYYFRLFVTNNNFCGISEQIKYSTGLNTEPTVPCVLESNLINYNYLDFNLDYLYKSVAYGQAGDYQVDADLKTESNQYISCMFVFKEEPTTGVYYTCENDENYLGNKNVYVELKNGLLKYGINSDSTVYVVNTENKFEISFCSITYTEWNGEMELKGNINSNNLE